MFSTSNTLSALVAVLAVMPAVKAHMSMFHPSMYGFNAGDTCVQPLAHKSFDQWWFHGQANDNPSETMQINPGQSLNIEIACSRAYSSWGDKPGGDACPNDQGSYHAGGQGGGGWGGNQDSNLMGCALAIAYKPSAQQTRPEDFTVMSVQENCVRQRDTSFQIPSNLPACPEGGCTCAWFWQGQYSDQEMYMTGFKCDVNGGAVGGSIPQPKPPVRGQISGPTQPMYWANNDGANVWGDFSWEGRPSYNSKWGWKNGAQEEAFEGSGGSPAPTRSSSKSSSSSSSSGSYPTGGSGSGSSSGDWQQGEQGQGDDGQWQGQGGQGGSGGRGSGNGNGNGNGNGGNPDWNNYAAAPTSSDAAAPTDGAGEGSYGGNSSGEHQPCKKVRRRRRSRTRRSTGSAHHARNVARH